MRKSDRFVIDNQQALVSCLAALSKVFADRDGKKVEVVFGEYTKDRTSLSNSYLHGWIFRSQLMKKLNESGQGVTDSNTGEYFEWDVDMLKAYFKAPYFQDRLDVNIITVKGKPFRKEFSPSNLDAVKFHKYCEMIKDFSAQKWGVIIEEPKGGNWLSIYRELVAK